MDSPPLKSCVGSLRLRPCPGGCGLGPLQEDPFVSWERLLGGVVAAGPFPLLGVCRCPSTGPAHPTAPSPPQARHPSREAPPAPENRGGVSAARQPGLSPSRGSALSPPADAVRGGREAESEEAAGGAPRVRTSRHTALSAHRVTPGASSRCPGAPVRRTRRGLQGPGARQRGPGQRPRDMGSAGGGAGGGRGRGASSVWLSGPQPASLLLLSP